MIVEMSGGSPPSLTGSAQGVPQGSVLGPCHVGTQVGAPRAPRAARPPLRHHASELLLTPARAAAAARTQRPAHPLFQPSGLSTGVNGYAGGGYTNGGYTGSVCGNGGAYSPPAYTGAACPAYPGSVSARARRRPPPCPGDSPTGSLDCLALRDAWSTEAMSYQGKMNGSALDERRLGPAASGGSLRSCRCPCRCGGDFGGDPQVPSPQSAEALSWRRLHMSRAKLKATATTSELLSGFAMIAMVELQINEPTNVPEWLFVIFAMCTTVLVAVHIFALMISTYLLPNIDAVSKMSAGDVLRESPHERMRGFIELAWAFSTVLGLFLFLVEIAILCWVKFWDYSFAAATAATVIVIPVLIIFVAFAVHFYHTLVVQKCDASTEDMEQLESMKRNLDTVTAQSISPV